MEDWVSDDEEEQMEQESDPECPNISLQRREYQATSTLENNPDCQTAWEDNRVLQYAPKQDHYPLET